MRHHPKAKWQEFHAQLKQSIFFTRPSPPQNKSVGVVESYHISAQSTRLFSSIMVHYNIRNLLHKSNNNRKTAAGETSKQ